MLYFIILLLNVMSAFVISNKDISMVLFDESYDDKGGDMFDVYRYETDDFDGSGMSDVVIPTSTYTTYINEDVTEQTTLHDEQYVGNDGNSFDNFVVNTVQYIIDWITNWF